MLTLEPPIWYQNDGNKYTIGNSPASLYFITSNQVTNATIKGQIGFYYFNTNPSYVPKIQTSTELGQLLYESGYRGLRRLRASGTVIEDSSGDTHEVINVSSDGTSGLYYIQVHTLDNRIFNLSPSWHFTPVLIYDFFPRQHRSLESDSWAQISEIALTNNADQYYRLGDTKSFTWNSNTFHARIVGFNHDTKQGGNKAGITFITDELTPQTYQMNTTESNSGGYISMPLSTTINTTIFNMLPADLQSVIVPVNKATSSGDGSSMVSETLYKLWLPGTHELWTNGPATTEGTQYQYYTNSIGSISWYNYNPILGKKSMGIGANYWTRSPFNSNMYSAVTFNGSFVDASPTSSYSIPLCFCL